jgi:hypothetical protein
MSGAIRPLPNTPSWHGAQLQRKHSDNFTIDWEFDEKYVRKFWVAVLSMPLPVSPFSTPISHTSY